MKTKISRYTWHIKIDIKIIVNIRKKVEINWWKRTPMSSHQYGPPSHTTQATVITKTSNMCHPTAGLRLLTVRGIDHDHLATYKEHQQGACLWTVTRLPFTWKRLTCFMRMYNKGLKRSPDNIQAPDAAHSALYGDIPYCIMQCGNRLTCFSAGGCRGGSLGLTDDSPH